MKKETPEEHVHESTGRQEEVAKATRATAAKLRKEAKDKAETLAIATDLLSSRVGTLADVVQINNARIEALQREVNEKPDDEELRFISGLATAERKRHLTYAVATAVLSAAVASSISYVAAREQVQERTLAAHEACVRNNNRAAIEAKVYRDIAKVTGGVVKARLEMAAMELDTLRADCQKKHPIGDDETVRLR